MSASDQREYYDCLGSDTISGRISEVLGWAGFAGCSFQKPSIKYKIPLPEPIQPLLNGPRSTGPEHETFEDLQ
jgi:hypothetical protein